VPLNKIADYKKAAGWKRFVNFKAAEIDAYSDGTLARYMVLDSKNIEIISVLECGTDYTDCFVFCGRRMYVGEYKVIDIPISINYKELSFKVKSFADNALDLNNSAVIDNSKVTKIRFGIYSKDTDANVDKAGKFAFANRQNLTDILLWSHNPPKLPAGYESTVFSNMNTSKIKLFVPEGSESKYKNAAVWKDFDIYGTDNSNTGTSYSSFDIIDIVNSVWLKAHPGIPVMHIEKIQKILSTPVMKKVITQIKNLLKADKFEVKMNDLAKVIQTQGVVNNLQEIRNLFSVSADNVISKNTAVASKAKTINNTEIDGGVITAKTKVKAKAVK
jgi:hypothetical protein